MTYLDQCTKYFAPLDEIVEAIVNKEPMQFASFKELIIVCHNNDDLSSDLDLYYDIDTFELI